MTEPGGRITATLCVLAAIAIHAAILAEQPIDRPSLPGQQSTHRGIVVNTQAPPASSDSGQASDKPEPQPDPQLEPKPEPRPEPESEPKPESEPEPEPEPEPKPEPQTAASKNEKLDAPDQQTLSESGSSPEARNDQERVMLGGGDRAEEDAYLAELSAHLARHYDYPRRARRLGYEGTVELAIGFNRDGTLNEREVEEGSGHGILDEAALKMLERAEPLPRVPDRIQGERFRLKLPIRFRMQ